MAPPSAASGETWPMDRPEVPPENRPSVMSAQAWNPVNRQREGAAALRAYAAMTTSAARGAVRDVTQFEKK